MILIKYAYYKFYTCILKACIKSEKNKFEKLKKENEELKKRLEE